MVILISLLTVMLIHWFAGKNDFDEIVKVRNFGVQTELFSDGVKAKF